MAAPEQQATMTFSVIIPCYNATDFLAETLESLLAQDCPTTAFEVIVVDDASTDDTVAVASAFTQRLTSLRVHQQSQNGGPGSARNAGLDMARGEWVIFLDSDDSLAPNSLSTLANFIDAHADESVSAIGYNWTSSELPEGLNSSKRIGRRDADFLLDRERRVHQYLMHRMDGSAIFTMVRREFLNRHPLRFADGFHEDVDFIFKVYFLSSNLLYCDSPVYRKRHHAASIVNTISAIHVDGYFRAWRQIGEFVESLPAENQADCLASYRYGSVGAVATRVREVVRHADAAAAPGLYERVYQHLSELIERRWLDPADCEGRTVYCQIARTFLATMSASEGRCSGETAAAITAFVDGLAGKSWSCVDLHHSLFLRPSEVRTCCKRFFVDGEMRGDVSLFDVDATNEYPVTANRILDAKRELHQKINSGEACACDGCPFLEFKDWSPLNQLDIKYLSMEYHSVCNMRCSYCSDEYYGGKRVVYDIQKTIEDLLVDQSLTNCATVVWGGGEPVLGPEFEPLLATLAEGLPNTQQRVLTNSIKASSGVSELLAKGQAQVVTSMDAGTQDTFRAIRGVPSMEKVCRTLSAYAKVNHQRVTIKYIFTEGNTAVEEVREFVKLMQKWALLDCNFQISGDFKREEIDKDAAISMVLLFGLLRQAGAQTVYFDELLRHRVGTVLDVGNVEEVNHIHELAGFTFLATPTHYQRVIIWGAGQQARYLMEKSSFFRHVDVTFFVDATPEKVGTRFFDNDVREPADLLSTDEPVVIAAVQGYPLILEQYRRLGGPDSRLVRELIL